MFIILVCIKGSMYACDMSSRDTIPQRSRKVKIALHFVQLFHRMKIRITVGGKFHHLYATQRGIRGKALIYVLD